MTQSVQLQLIDPVTRDTLHSAGILLDNSEHETKTIYVPRGVVVVSKPADAPE